MDKYAGIREKLFPYQVDGIRRLCRLKGRALLLDDIGLGKTVQCIFMADALERYPTLVVCPGGLRHNWRKEILMWLPWIAKADVCLVDDGKKAIDPAAKFVLISYDLAARRLDELLEMDFKQVVVDEAHNIKTHNGKRTKALMALALRFPDVVAVTGTPALNRPVELWPLLVLVRLPGIEKYFPFTKRYCKGHHKDIWYKDQLGRAQRKKIYDDSGADNLPELYGRMQPLMLRRRRDDVLTELPPLMRSVVTVEPMGDGALAKLLAAFDGGIEEDELCSCMLEEYAMLGEHKAPRAIELIADSVTPKEPMVVFAHHLPVIDLMANELRERGLRVACITGGVSTSRRHEYVEGFQAGKLDVLICGIMAANAGITLTRACQMLVVELPWSPFIAKQMEGRIHRISQARPVSIRYMVVEDSFDERIWELQQEKVRIASQVIDGGEGIETFDFDAEEASGQRALVRAILEEKAHGPGSAKPVAA